MIRQIESQHGGSASTKYEFYGLFAEEKKMQK
jgi:hypothetical protein